MNITNDYPVTIFKREYQGRIFYNLGLSKKNQDGSYTNGYMSCQFKKDVVLDDRTNIYIKKAFLSFYLKDKETKPYIFISEFQTVAATIEKAKKEVDPYKEFGESIEITNDDLPF